MACGIRQTRSDTGMTAFGLAAAHISIIHGQSYSIWIKGICVPIDEQIVFSQLDKDEDAVFSFLLAGGYLKVQEKQVQEYHLQLVNEEAHQMFEHLINGWFSECRVSERI